MHASAHYGAVSRTARRGMRDKAWEWRREITFHGPHARLRPDRALFLYFFKALWATRIHTRLRKTLLDPRTSSCALAPPHKSSNRRSSHTQNLDDCSNRNTMKPTARRPAASAAAPGHQRPLSTSPTPQAPVAGARGGAGAIRISQRTKNYEGPPRSAGRTAWTRLGIPTFFGP